VSPRAAAKVRAQLGFHVEFRIQPVMVLVNPRTREFAYEGPDIADFVFRWIDFIEKINLQMGGGGSPGGWDFFVTTAEKSPRHNCIELDRQHVLGWLHAQPEVMYAMVGPLVDAGE
jgi:uncharacterized protein YggL (DUF469 family)